MEKESEGIEEVESLEGIKGRGGGWTVMKDNGEAGPG